MKTNIAKKDRENGLRVRSGVKAGGFGQHNPTSKLRVRTGVRAGGTQNHAQRLSALHVR